MVGGNCGEKKNEMREGSIGARGRRLLLCLLIASYLYHLFLICKITKMLQSLHNAPKTAQLNSLVYLLLQFVAIHNKHFPLGGDLLFYGKLS